MPGPEPEPTLDADGDALRPWMRLIRQTAHKYERRLALDFGEMESIAMLGAWQAINTYDPDRGVPLSAWIAMGARREMHDQIRREWGRHFQRAPDIPTDALWRWHPTTARYADIEDQDQVAHLLATLPIREAYVLQRRYIDDAEGKQVAAELGVHPSRISQITNDAFAHSRRLLATP